MILLKPITPTEVDKVWDSLKTWVKNSLAGDKSYTTDDIRAEIVGRSIQLWVIYKDDIPTGFLTTQVNQAPQGITVYSPWLGGEDLDEWVAEGLEQLKVWLKKIGSLSYSWVGRPAWQKLVKVDSKQCCYTIYL